MGSQQSPNSLPAPDQGEPSLSNLGNLSPSNSDDGNGVSDSGHDTPAEYVDEVAAAWEATKGEREEAARAEVEHVRRLQEEQRRVTEHQSGTEAESRESVDGQSQSQAKDDSTSDPKAPDRVPSHALARFHQQQKEFFAEKQAFKAERTEAARVKELLDNAKNDPLAAIEAMGYTDSKEFLNQIAEHGGRETPERKRIRELEAWKTRQEKETAQRNEEAAAAQAQRDTQAKLDQIKQQVQHTLRGDAYADSYLRLAGTDDNVMAEMDRMATETGEMPRIEDAIAAVKGRYETYLGELAQNPAVVRFFSSRQQAQPSSSPPQSKQRERPRTIDSGARSPGTRTQSRDEYPSEEDVLAESTRYLNSLR